MAIEKIHRDIWLTRDMRVQEIAVVEDSQTEIELEIKDKTIPNTATAKAYYLDVKTNTRTNPIDCGNVTSNTISINPVSGFFVPGRGKLQVEISDTKLYITFGIPVDCEQRTGKTSEYTPPTSGGTGSGAGGALKPLKITVNGTTTTYDGTSEKTVTIASGSGGTVVVPTFSIGTVETNATGAASVELEKSGNDYKFNFSVPRGLDGQDGETQVLYPSIGTPTVETLPAGSNAEVSASVSGGKLVFAFKIPRGADGSGTATLASGDEEAW